MEFSLRIIIARGNRSTHPRDRACCHCDRPRYQTFFRWLFPRNGPFVNEANRSYAFSQKLRTSACAGANAVHGDWFDRLSGRSCYGNCAAAYRRAFGGPQEDNAARRWAAAGNGPIRNVVPRGPSSVRKTEFIRVRLLLRIVAAGNVGRKSKLDSPAVAGPSRGRLRSFRNIQIVGASVVRATGPYGIPELARFVPQGGIHPRTSSCVLSQRQSIACGRSRYLPAGSTGGQPGISRISAGRCTNSFVNSGLKPHRL